MAGVIGSIGPFDESMEQWSSSTECFGYFVMANGIQDDKLVPIFLSVIGPKTFNLLRNLLQPAKPCSKTLQEIVDTLTDRFSLKPQVMKLSHIPLSCRLYWESTKRFFVKS